MIKIRTLLICLSLGAGICLPQTMRGQVTIGENKDPKSFSVLELIDEARGLRMPSMTTAQRDAIDMGSYAATTAQGLTIYNTDINCIEYWNGSSWMNTCGIPSQPAAGGTVIYPKYNTNTGDIQLYTGAAFTGGTGDLTTRGSGVVYNNVAAGVFNYTGGEGQSLPRLEFTHASGVTVIIPAQTLNGSEEYPASGQITIMVSGIPSPAYAGKAFDIPIVLLNSGLTVRVNVGCGAYIGDKMVTDADGFATNWLQFQCYNLGATTNIDPLVGNQYLHGSKYRFGTSKPALTMAQDQANTGGISGWNSKPIQSGSADWSTANNPCSDGWRLPTKTEYEQLISTSNNTQVKKGEWDPYSQWFEYGFTSGILYGGALFLPAAGYRYNLSPAGALYFRGTAGYYWSSSASGTKAYYMEPNVTDSRVSDTSREYGFSVRCVAK